MARLTAEQVELQGRREKERLETLKKKAEIQHKKETLGENWKIIEQKRLQEEIEFEIGADNAPKLYDFKDIYEYFDPIFFYKDPVNKSLKMDFKEFSKSEEMYKVALEDLDKEIEKVSLPDNIKAVIVTFYTVLYTIVFKTDVPT